MIVILTEEPSMRATLRVLISQQWSESIEGVDWHVIAYEGKADLERNIKKKMLSWNYGDPHFVILRDSDRADCLALKAKLAEKAECGGKPYHIRLVCQELESWFIGDRDAVIEAYPRVIFPANISKYRDPDRIANASEELAKLTGDRAKVARAELIAPRMRPDQNRSKSFQVTYQTLASFLT